MPARGAYRSNIETLTTRQIKEVEKRRARANDHATSIAGAADVDIRAWSQKKKLLLQFSNWPLGLTDEEAANLAGLTKACYWKRCGELRYDGHLVLNWDDEKERTVHTRKGAAGVYRMVSKITPEGKKAITNLKTGN